MSWLNKLFGDKQKPAASRPSRSLAGKNVALALVHNPGGTFILNASGDTVAGGVTEKMVRDFIRSDLARYPELRAKAAAVQEVVIVSDATVSFSDYAQDMTAAYLRYMNQGGWARPGGLHIFETILAQVRVYIAYGI